MYELAKQRHAEKKVAQLKAYQASFVARPSSSSKRGLPSLTKVMEPSPSDLDPGEVPEDTEMRMLEEALDGGWAQKALSSIPRADDDVAANRSGEAAAPALSARRRSNASRAGSSDDGGIDDLHRSTLDLRTESTDSVDVRIERLNRSTSIGIVITPPAQSANTTGTRLGPGTPSPGSSEPASPTPYSFGARKTNRDRLSNPGAASGRMGPFGTMRSTGTLEELKPYEISEGLAEELARLDMPEDGLSEKEIDRCNAVFGRFREAGESDLHKDNITHALRYLGFMINAEKHIKPVLKKITTFDYLDFNDFCLFIQNYKIHQNGVFRTIFDEFDEDKSGEISGDELCKLMRALGFMPLHAMIAEALSVVDKNNNGKLEFDELLRFVTVYTYNEGFTQMEVQEFQDQFDHFSQEGIYGGVRCTALPASSVMDALTMAMGLHVREIVDKVAKQLNILKEDGGLHFSEFLIVARTIREHQFQSFIAEYEHTVGHSCPRHLRFGSLMLSEPEAFRKDLAELVHDAGQEVAAEGVAEPQEKFEQFDVDGSGKISDAELRRMLTLLGYTPLRQVLNEIYQEVYDDWKPGVELDFNQLFDFTLIWKKRDGFRKKELKDMQRTFSKFDREKKQEISVFDLGEMMRHLGYGMTQYDIHNFVSMVDSNGNGVLDFREFQHLMRLLRERECGKVKRQFDSFCKEEQCDVLPISKIDLALHSLGYEMPHKNTRVSFTVGAFTDMDFDAFMGLVDTCRSSYVEKNRKKAGFSDEELAQFKEMFHNFDSDNSGCIDVKELAKLLKEFGWEPHTAQDQKGLLRKISNARALAREAGAIVCQKGSSLDDPEDAHDVGEIHFWTFVQLMRTLRSEEDTAEERSVHELREELHFSEGEVEQFRQIFGKYVHRDKPKVTTVRTPIDYMEGDAVRRLFRSLGAKIDIKDGRDFDQKICELDQTHHRDHARLDFAGFLRIMKWVLDTNFAGINTLLREQKMTVQ